MTGRIWRRAGDAQTGILIHRVIADLLSPGFDASEPAPAWERVLYATDRRMMLDGFRDRAARQRITVGALSYLRVVPPPPWQFQGAEVRLPGVRLDVLWINTVTGALLVDEIKTGQFGALLPSTQAQVERYVAAVVASRTGAGPVYGRAVGTRTPVTSWTRPPEGVPDLCPLTGRPPPP